MKSDYRCKIPASSQEKMMMYHYASCSLIVCSEVALEGQQNIVESKVVGKQNELE